MSYGPALAINGFNIGQDVSVSIADDLGNSFPADILGLLMEVDARATDTMIKVTPISGGGRPLFARIPAGWSGRMTFTRTNGSLQNLIAGLESAFYNGGIIIQYNFSMNVLNRDGTVDRYTFVNAQFEKPSFGAFRADKEVDVPIEFVASELIVPTSSLAGLGLSILNF